MGIAIRAEDVVVVQHPSAGHEHDPREIGPGAGLYGLHRYTMAGTASCVETDPQLTDAGFANNFAVTTATQAFVVTPGPRPEGLAEGSAIVVTGYAEVIGPQLHYAYDLPNVRTDWTVGTVRRLMHDHRIIGTDGESTFLAPDQVRFDEVIEHTDPSADLDALRTDPRYRVPGHRLDFVYLADLTPRGQWAAGPRPGFRIWPSADDD